MAQQNSTLTTSLTRPGQSNSAGDQRALFKVVQRGNVQRLPAKHNRTRSCNEENTSKR